MKKFSSPSISALVLSLWILPAPVVFSQTDSVEAKSITPVFYYQFEQDFIPYSPISQDHDATDGSPYRRNVSPPFKLSFFDRPMTKFSTDIGASLYFYDEMGNSALITPSSIPFDARWGQGELLEEVSGLEPNRIWKLEWRDMPLWDNGQESFVNIQLWIYEKGGVEFRYGPSALSEEGFNQLSEEFLIATGLTAIYSDMHLEYDWFTSVSHTQTLFGNPVDAQCIDTVGLLSAWPENGTVYRFYQPGVELVEDESVLLKVYPNPTTEWVFMDGTDTEIREVTLTSVAGQVVLSGQLSTLTPLDVSGVIPGTYLMELFNPVTENRQSLRLVIL